VRRFRRGVGRWLQDAEDEHDPARSGDLDLGGQCLEESLGLIVASRADDLADIVGDLLEYGGRRDRRRFGELCGELIPAGG